jgi:hypothetical protein
MRVSIGGAFAMVAALLAAGGGSASAQTPASGQARADDDDPSAAGPAEKSSLREGIEGGGIDDYQTAEEKKKARIEPEYGIGVRLRTIYVPKPVFELFVDEASSGVLKPGFGLEFTRRKGKVEFVLGVEYENVSPDDGFWLDRGSDPNVATETPDFFEFKDLAWLTADLAILYNAPISDHVSFRFGAGLGIGLVFGEIRQTDSICQPGTDDVQKDCMANPNGGQVNEQVDLLPVYPVVDLFIVGLQFRPIDRFTINLETGIRTVGFFGLSTNYYF